MPTFTKPLPLSLYIHLPWCVRKCPYCDFNSHAVKDSFPEEAYTQALLQELEDHLPLINDRPLISIFFGGGTPSLFSSEAIERILKGIQNRVSFADDIEITLEANPGTIDQVRFAGFYQAGINRLSIGVQSLQNDKLQTLGRIHDRDNALQAVQLAKAAGFTNFNIDLMYGLPNQTIEDALTDIKTALTLHPSHLSWYQLTLEPNTLFYHQPPSLPDEDLIWEMQQAGQRLIAASGFQPYEVSAYALTDRQCKHNLNYWEFGDYLGIGAGAHSKLTDIHSHSVMRFSQIKHPRDYLNLEKRRIQKIITLNEKDLIFEFMLNALRLTHGVSTHLFIERTGLALMDIEDLWRLAMERGLLQKNAEKICPTSHGKKFLNDLVAMFLN